MPTDDTTTAAWGEQCKQARLARGWTQMQLARRTGIAQSAICRIEATGGGTLRSSLALASALGLSIDALMREAA